ncbi:MAG: 6,7-dimethyl-8-ribityllumazine synthase [Bacteroidaceae bacterium]|nr:6,7-dimethyl-8-ribityllumazine synthase [Bacteroidaceae bacterium]MBQ2460454.1 6,7-dimethyl-8-ribityllumazine synthase [Bacteroidaceae bacterium]MBQ2518567.1 6,7-dimethyl-8-ribityllumazine synthase [Bacteroidaceae bacterium]MBQ2595490.1 6,7-dimethyl-8-ribityllumazine synthase [Bacteroidaceae bacterium]MBQ3993008.1 6,7-dimethyl-8-ribityllumazine synthase [Bacteroidaceae bacterium]
MASSLHNLSDYDANTLPSTEGMRFGIVVSEWNSNVTGALLDGAVSTLMKNGVGEDKILVKSVPGSFELVFGASQMVKSGLVDAVIAIGCVIRGDTPHFDYICMGATQGLAELNLHGEVPVIYGLLTCNNMEQALQRCGGSLGNKGDEAAVTAIRMVDYRRQVRR